MIRAARTSEDLDKETNPTNSVGLIQLYIFLLKDYYDTKHDKYNLIDLLTGQYKDFINKKFINHRDQQPLLEHGTKFLSSQISFLINNNLLDITESKNEIPEDTKQAE